MWRDTSVWDDVRRDMDQMFCKLSRLPSLSLIESNYREPLTDVEELDTEVVVTAELPGLERDSITVNPANGGIEIRAEKQAERTHRKGMYRYERNYAGFYRYVSLPPEADASKAKARYSKGVLELRIPKQATKQEKIRVEGA